MEITISGIQFDIVWENKNANINKLELLLQDIPDNTDIVILPEMFTTGFSMNTKLLAESMDGFTVNWMLEKASMLNKVISGSIIIKENDIYRNRFLWVEPNGNIQYYDKKHSFGLGNEDKFYTNGNKRIIIEYKGWKIFPSICYDLRFPKWLKNTLGYDILLNVASWPKVRAAHWNTFLKSRAIENQSYAIGINRVGIDGNNINYSGDSAIIDFDGNILNYIGNTQGIITTTLSKSKLDNYRKSFPFLKDQD